MKITAAVVPVRSAPFEIETSTSWRRWPMRCLCGSWPAAYATPICMLATAISRTCHIRSFAAVKARVLSSRWGADVADLEPGDPIVISFPWCGECGPCRAQRIACCEHAGPLKSSGRRADGSIPMSRNGDPVYSSFFQQSSFASFAVAPAKGIVKIRRDAPIEMLGPLGCGLQTGAGLVLNVMQRATGQSIAVYGVGGVGLAGLMAARSQAASDHRRRLAPQPADARPRTRCYAHARKPRRRGARRNP